MEMCYDGMLVMPATYAVMNEEEMTYVDGGISKSAAKSLVISAVASLVTQVAKKAVSTSAVGSVISACGSWVGGVIDTAIIAAMVHPVAATVIAVAGLAAITGTVYAVGKKKGYW